MINPATAVIYGRQKKAPNTFIGGIAKTGGTGVNAPIDTIPKLATKLGIAENRISSFKITGNDVSFYISGNYSVGNSSLSRFGASNTVDANKNITYYYDISGNVTGLGMYCFRYCTNFEDFIFSSNLNTIGNGAFMYTKIPHLNMPYLSSSLSGEWTNMAQFCTEIVDVNLGELTNTIGNTSSIFRGNTKLENYIGKIKYFGQMFRGAGAINATFQNTHVIYLGDYSFESARFQKVEVPNCTRITAGAFYQASGTRYLKQVIAPLTTAINNTSGTTDGVFRGQNNLELVDIRACKYFYGRTIGDTNTYNFRESCKSGTVVKVHEFMATSNSGNPEPELLYIKNTRGGIVEFYDDAGNYVSTL